MMEDSIFLSWYQTFFLYQNRNLQVDCREILSLQILKADRNLSEGLKFWYTYITSCAPTKTVESPGKLNVIMR